ncbi:hypothetical protein C0J52_22628 [Blattella germanica]|nr:hypothetical protein C0J52_22628 [Blattella germanica]
MQSKVSQDFLSRNNTKKASSPPPTPSCISRLEPVFGMQQHLTYRNEMKSYYHHHRRREIRKMCATRTKILTSSAAIGGWIPPLLHLLPAGKSFVLARTALALQLIGSSRTGNSGKSPVVADMSTAVMSTSALYEFGDLLYKFIAGPVGSHCIERDGTRLTIAPV